MEQYDRARKWLEECNNELSERINAGDPTATWIDILYNVKCIEAIDQEQIIGAYSEPFDQDANQ